MLAIITDVAQIVINRNCKKKFCCSKCRGGGGWLGGWRAPFAHPHVSFAVTSHSAYAKIDAYFLQFLCHMTSDVTFPEAFFFFLFILLFEGFILQSKKNFDH